jgi:trehalose 6-phosphate phosphatase
MSGQHARAGQSSGRLHTIALARAALFLDLDGTLAPIALRPVDVRPDPIRTSLVRDLARALDGRLAVVSGRTMEDVDRILEGAAENIAGLHGLERRHDDGRRVLSAPAPGLGEARAELAAFAAARPGALIEDKGACVTLHYRAAPGIEAEALAFAARVADAWGLLLQRGKMVAELRTPGPDKGDVVRTFLSEPAFAGSVPVFVGDDLTDEHGFEAARAAGGLGVLVGPARPSAAEARLRDVSHALSWLQRSAFCGVFDLTEAAWDA